MDRQHVTIHDLVEAISSELGRSISPQFYHTLPQGLGDGDPSYHPFLSTEDILRLCEKAWNSLFSSSAPDAIEVRGSSILGPNLSLLETAYQAARSRHCRDGPSPPRQ